MEYLAAPAAPAAPTALEKRLGFRIGHWELHRVIGTKCCNLPLSSISSSSPSCNESARARVGVGILSIYLFLSVPVAGCRLSKNVYYGHFMAFDGVCVLCNRPFFVLTCLGASDIFRVSVCAREPSEIKTSDSSPSDSDDVSESDLSKSN